MTKEDFQKVEGLHLRIVPDMGVLIEGISLEQTIEVFKQARWSLEMPQQFTLEETEKLVDLIEKSCNGTEMFHVNFDTWRGYCRELQSFMESKGFSKPQIRGAE